MDIFDISEHQTLFLAPTSKQVRSGTVKPIAVFVVGVSHVSEYLDCKHKEAPYRQMRLLPEDVVPTSDEYFAAARDLALAEKRKARIRFERSLRKLENAAELAGAKTAGAWTR